MIDRGGHGGDRVGDAGPVLDKPGVGEVFRQLPLKAAAVVAHQDGADSGGAAGDENFAQRGGGRGEDDLFAGVAGG